MFLTPQKPLGGGEKRPGNFLLIAVFAGCISFNISPANAEDSEIEFPSVPKELNQGTLDYLHANNVKMPGTDEVYPESSYTLKETTDIDPENIPDGIVTKYEKQRVTKYYDPVSGDEVDADKLQDGVNYREVHLFELVPKYYELGYKKDVYGEGNDTNYFKWEKNENGDYELEIASDQDAQITVHYDESKNIRKEINETTGEIKQEFVNLSTDQAPKYTQGGAIYNNNSITNIISDFIGNNIHNDIDDNSYVLGGAIYNGNGAEIQNIKGDFIGNYSRAGLKAVGGAIYNESSEIQKIEGDFIGNYINSKVVEGGAIANFFGKLGDIKGNFIRNYAYSNAYSDTFADGGAITNYEAKIGNIEGNFAYNYAHSNGDAIGGAIYNENKAEIQKIEGDFIGNYTNSETNYAQGGAIANVSSKIDGGIKGNFKGNHSDSYLNARGGAIFNNNNAEIQKIEGDFIGNYTKSEKNKSEGGAIANVSSKIDGGIKGNFIGNYTYSKEYYALGGAIDNYDSKIGDIEGNFEYNYARSINSNASGGAIKNDGYDVSEGESSIGNITGNFIGNYAQGRNIASGGAVFNENHAKIGDITGNFIENYATSSDSEAHGGAIYNYTGSSIGEIKGDFIGNYSSTEGNTSHGGAIDNCNSIITKITGDFIKNYSQGAKDSFGGAIYNYNTQEYSDSKIGDLTGNFIGNRAISSDGNAKGGAIYNQGAEIGNIKGNFYSNSANGKTGQGGALANTGKIGNIHGDFVSNSASSLGGAIYNEGKIGIAEEKGIYNSSFYNNIAGEHGGAIYTTADLTITADGEESLFKGNFVGNDTTKDYEAVYVDGKTLTLNAKNKGTIQFDDKINGDNDYKINIKGDNTSLVVLNNTVNDANASLTGTTLQIGITNKEGNISNVFKSSTLDVQSGRVDIADANFVDYEFEQLTSDKEGKYAFDIAFDGIEGKSDRFVVDNDSNGTITLSNLVVSTIDGFVEKADDEKEYFIQIIKNKKNNDNLKLALDNEIRHITEAESGMSSKDILSKEFEISKKDTADDSIKIAGWRDSLAAWAELETDEEKVFELKDNDKQLLTRDAELKGKNLKIQGTNNNRLDLNDKKLLNNIGNEQNVEIKDVVVLNADNIDNEGTITLDTVRLERSSKITNNKNLTVKGKTNINGTITSDSKGTLNFDGADTNITGKVENQKITGTKDSTINLYNRNDFKNNSLDLKNTTLNVFDLGSDELHLNNLAVNNSTINIDSVNVDLANVKMGRIISDNYGDVVTPSINIKDLKVLKDSRDLVTHVQFTDSTELAQGVNSDVTQAEGPIFRYLVSYSSSSPSQTRSVNSDSSEGGTFIFTRGDANPAVMTSSVAQLAGGYASMIQSLEFAFEHADTFSDLPQRIRQAKSDSNKYAINEADTKLIGYANEFNSKGLWFKPYTSFESIPIKNGYDVDTVIYGSYIGGDSELIHLKNGWDTVSSGYIGYTGSSQAYEGNHTYQNGIVGGVTQTFYKDNFYTAITASVGSSIGETSTKYGQEDFSMLMAGAASKTGYNFEFKNGKYIIQPTLLMAYTMINTFDYTNAAGVNINIEPLHALHVHPYIKFVQNTESGWQPYLSAGFVYNVMGSTQITADEFSLPSLSVKPYAEYGLGVQKLWNDKYTGYLQAMVRNGGRNGVAFTAGFRMALGNEEKIEKVQKDNNIKPVNNKIVKTEPKKANVVKKAENKVKVQKVQKVKKSDNKVKTVKAEKQHPLLNKISNFFSGNNSNIQPTGEKKIFKKLTAEQRTLYNI